MVSMARWASRTGVQLVSDLGLFVQMAEQTGEALVRPERPRLHGAERDAQPFCDLGVGVRLGAAPVGGISRA
jgi:hypothetical protein